MADQRQYQQAAEQYFALPTSGPKGNLQGAYHKKLRAAADGGNARARAVLEIIDQRHSGSIRRPAPEKVQLTGGDGRSLEVELAPPAKRNPRKEAGARVLEFQEKRPVDAARVGSFLFGGGLEGLLTIPLGGAAVVQDGPFLENWERNLDAARVLGLEGDLAPAHEAGLEYLMSKEGGGFSRDEALNHLPIEEVRRLAMSRDDKGRLDMYNTASAQPWFFLGASLGNPGGVAGGVSRRAAKHMGGLAGGVTRLAGVGADNVSALAWMYAGARVFDDDPEAGAALIPLGWAAVRAAATGGYGAAKWGMGKIRKKGSGSLAEIYAPTNPYDQLGGDEGARLRAAFREKRDAAWEGGGDLGFGRRGAPMDEGDRAAMEGAMEIEGVPDIPVGAGLEPDVAQELIRMSARSRPSATAALLARIRAWQSASFGAMREHNESALKSLRVPNVVYGRARDGLVGNVQRHAWEQYNAEKADVNKVLPIQWDGSVKVEFNIGGKLEEIFAQSDTAFVAGRAGRVGKHHPQAREPGDLPDDDKAKIKAAQDEAEAWQVKSDGLEVERAAMRENLARERATYMAAKNMRDKIAAALENKKEGQDAWITLDDGRRHRVGHDDLEKANATFNDIKPVYQGLKQESDALAVEADVAMKNARVKKALLSGKRVYTPRELQDLSQLAGDHYWRLKNAVDHGADRGADMTVVKSFLDEVNLALQKADPEGFAKYRRWQQDYHAFKTRQSTGFLNELRAKGAARDTKFFSRLTAALSNPDEVAEWIERGGGLKAVVGTAAELLTGDQMIKLAKKLYTEGDAKEMYSQFSRRGLTEFRRRITKMAAVEMMRPNRRGRRVHEFMKTDDGRQALQRMFTHFKDLPEGKMLRTSALDELVFTPVSRKNRPVALHDALREFLDPKKGLPEMLTEAEQDALHFVADASDNMVQMERGILRAVEDAANKGGAKRLAQHSFMIMNRSLWAGARWLSVTAASKVGVDILDALHGENMLIRLAMDLSDSDEAAMHAMRKWRTLTEKKVATEADGKRVWLPYIQSAYNKTAAAAGIIQRHTVPALRVSEDETDEAVVREQGHRAGEALEALNELERQSGREGAGR